MEEDTLFMDREKNFITVESDVDDLLDDELIAMLKETVNTALTVEGVEVPCEINILLTDDEGIQEVNRQMREIDAPTDVLSFPMFDLKPGEKPTEEDCDPGTETAPLGDMCISVERAQAQAEEYGHCFAREINYLCVHSVLHLLGYDHMDEGEMKAQMREHEERIMKVLDLTR